MSEQVSLEFKARPRREAGHLEVNWDHAAQVLTAALSYDLPQHPAPPTLAEQLDKELVREDRTSRVVIGDLDLLFDGEGRLSQVELRTDSAEWLHQSLSEAHAAAQQVDMVFELDFDKNRIASVEGETKVIVDRVERSLVIVFGAPSATRWFSLADGLLAGMSEDERLSQLRFAELSAIIEWSDHGDNEQRFN